MVAGQDRLNLAETQISGEYSMFQGPAKFLISVSVLSILCGSAVSQPTYQLAFEFTPGSGPLPPVYRWFSDSEAMTTTSPGGTTIHFIGAATFHSFSDFQNDIVGQWQLTDSSMNVATFEILAFDQSEFPTVEMLFPASGQQFLSGEVVTGDLFPDNFPNTSLSVSSNPDEVMVQFLGGLSFRFTLLPGVEQSMPLLRGSGGFVREGLVTDIGGDKVPFAISEDIGIVGTTVLVPITIVDGFAIGDVNRDGSVDLQDIAPFVALLTQGDYQIEADINMDGAVDLSDVALFVDLLTG